MQVWVGYKWLLKMILTQNSHLHTGFSKHSAAGHFTVVPPSILTGHFAELQIVVV